MRLPIALFLCFCALSQPVLAQETSQTYDLVTKVLANIEEVKTVAYTMRSTELMDDGMQTKTSSAKVSYSPLKVYLKMHPPETEREVLWHEGEHDNDALVNPAAFPYFNVRLDPMGNMMRGSNHHTLYDAGFTRFADIIRHALEKSGARFDDYFHLLPDTSWNNYSCKRVEIDNFDYAISDYTVQADEDVNDIARRLNISEYKILLLNKEVDDLDDVDEGDVIQIPSDYARKVRIYIDTELMLPVRLEIEDENGLFEQYEYLKLEINPTFSEEDFSSDNPEYGF